MSNQLLVVRSGLTLLETLDTPFSNALYICINAGEWNEAFRLIGELHPARYNCALKFKKDSYSAAWFKKLNIDVLGIDRTAAGHKKWLEAEEICKLNNDRLGPLSGANSILKRAKSLVQKVLGPLDADALREISEACKHGPGAAVGARGKRANAKAKLSTIPTITYEAIHLVRFFHDHLWIRSIHEDKRPFLVVPGNVLTYVPKDAKTERPIGIEPSFNMYVQLGVGGYIRNRLRRVGINLNEGQDLHRRLAQIGSATSKYATIDLSSASDTISRELIKNVLPPSWYQFLDSIRSQATELPDGELVKIEKFSSMGNGFTFELETLVFWALCRTVTDFTSVYGDDMIVPNEDFESVCKFLELCGLVVNTEKSYATTYFRESCGGDYFHNKSCRGVYSKEEPVTVFEKMQLANQLFDSADSIFFDLYLRKAWNVIVQSIPRSQRLFGPQDLGSAVIHAVEFPSIYKNSQYFVEGLKPITKRIPVNSRNPLVTLAIALSGHSSSGVIPRGSVLRHKVVRYPVRGPSNTYSNTELGRRLTSSLMSNDNQW